jgi:hypothetical protein
LPYFITREMKERFYCKIYKLISHLYQNMKALDLRRRKKHPNLKINFNINKANNNNHHIKIGLTDVEND